MGKKYIIELESGTHIFVLGPEGIVHIGEPDVVYETVDGMQIGDAVINAKPYTEPDLEQVREEAYQKGQKDLRAQIEEAYDCGHDEGYKLGLADAWEAARGVGHCKLWRDYTKDTGKTSVCAVDVLDYYTAAEAVEKLKAYEQEKEFKVGDEFENGAGKKFVVLKMDGKEIDRYIDGDGKTYVMDTKYSGIRKTDRHFPEIAAVLEKMRGENND